MFTLYEDEDAEQDGGEDEQQDDAPVRPGILGAAPLKGEEQADDGWHEDCCSERVEALDALDEGVVVSDCAFGVREEECDHEDSDRADGQVDPEAPAPGDLVGEDSAE